VNAGRPAPGEANPHLRHWTLEPHLLFLNHGSFGATPRPVLAVQDQWRARMEANPVRFLARELEPALDEARRRLAAFVGADPHGLAFVPNATTGVNTVLRALALGPGDELLLTNHGYNACRNAALEVAHSRGAAVVEAGVPFPVAGPAAVAAAVLGRIGPRTRAVLIDHVTSPTGLVLPVGELVRELHDRGVTAIVDGAHAPGMMELDLARLGADFYVANCHKWLCAPKGAAFLWVDEAHRARTRPLVISHGANAASSGRSRFRLEFDWTGTDDPTAWLAVPAAIDFLGGLLPGGWPALLARNRSLVLEARRLLSAVLSVAPPEPEEMVGSLAALPLPPLPDAEAGQASMHGALDPLQRALLERHRIEVPVIAWPDPASRLLRISAHVYNALWEYEALAAALVAEGVAP
jgi:isopenicillin-N epimerase